MTIGVKIDSFTRASASEPALKAAGKTHSEFGPEAAVAGVRAEKKQLILANALFRNNVVRWSDLFDTNKVIWGSEREFFDNNIKPLKNEL